MDTTTWILIYLGIALAGSVIPFIRVYFSHFHHLINLGSMGTVLPLFVGIFQNLSIHERHD